MIIKYKNNSDLSIHVVDSENMAILDKLNLIKNVRNFDIIILKDNNDLDDQKRLLILKGEF